MENYKNHTSIRQWAEDDRPREKMLLKGKGALSNAELLAILLGSGNKGQTAVDLAKQILDHVSNNLFELSRMTIADLTKFKGIGTVKALSIMTALELGQRRRSEEVIERKKITGSKDIFELMQGILADAAYEEFWIVLMNRSNKLLGRLNISEGGLSGTVADPKKIFKMALEQNASSIILCHNHPSGNHLPSDADIQLTRKMKEAGNMLDMPVLDHIIIAHNRYYSFADEGML
jgi:DNA repair protein RadC